MTNLKFKIINIFFYVLIYFFVLSPTILQAKIFKEISVKGNKRLALETVLMFSGLKTEVDYDIDDLNLAIKKLYETDYFKYVEANISGDKLEIIIEENPIIQSITINGIKNKSILKQLLEITKKSEKYPFLRNNVESEKNLLLNFVRSSGFYFSEIEAKIIDNKNNSIDLIYNFNLG